jgi:hypothetical protein
MSRARLAARLDRLEAAHRPIDQDGPCVPFEPSDEWWQEFWAIVEESGYRDDIIAVLTGGIDAP